MPSKLDLKDFRAGRWVLLSSDFAIAPEGPAPPPRDLIDKETWESIIQLTDNVTIETTNDYGSTIRLAETIQSEWVSLTLNIFGTGDSEASPFNQTVVNSFSELQASLFDALSGYYRTGISILRNVLEHLTIGLDFELRHSRTKFDDWMNGNDDDSVKFGNSASGITNKNNVQVIAFEARLMAAVCDNVFRQKNKSIGDAGGVSRRLFSELSKYTHGAPGKTKADLWESNGPVYRPDVFEDWCDLYGRTMALAVVMLRIALSAGGTQDPQIKTLYEETLTLIPNASDGATLLKAIASDPIWT
jgi:hypothetical protein